MSWFPEKDELTKNKFLLLQKSLGEKMVVGYYAYLIFSTFISETGKDTITRN